MPTAHQIDNGVAEAQSRYSAASVPHTSSVLSRRLRERRLLPTAFKSSIDIGKPWRLIEGCWLRASPLDLGSWLTKAFSASELHMGRVLNRVQCN
jgi:hypothetical protein